MSLDQTAREEARRIARELSSIARTGKVLPGSIQERLTRCGRTGCACQADPPHPHGPYWQWTRKLNKKTISRWLSARHAADYQHWIDNDRRIRELLARLEAIGIASLEADRLTTREGRNQPAQRHH
jgi:hypothetical protein